MNIEQMKASTLTRPSLSYSFSVSEHETLMCKRNTYGGWGNDDFSWKLVDKTSPVYRITEIRESKADRILRGLVE